jgi:hypothetical protein
MQSINYLSKVLVAGLFSLLLVLMPSYAQQGSNNMSDSEPVDGVTFRFIESNGLNMRIAEIGESGPLVLMAHGWP